MEPRETLTEFGASREDEDEDLVTGPGFFSRWFRAKSPEGGTGSEVVHHMGGSSQVPDSLRASQTSLDAAASALLRRRPSLSSVTRKVSGMLKKAEAPPALDPKTGKPLLDYDASNFKQYWMPDWRSKECYECEERFTTLRRRHHCRICGQIFCSKCCSREIPGRTLGYVGALRLCNFCADKVISAGLLSENAVPPAIKTSRQSSGSPTAEVGVVDEEASAEPLVTPAVTDKAWPFSDAVLARPREDVRPRTPLAQQEDESEWEPDWVARIPRARASLGPGALDQSGPETPVNEEAESSFDMCEEAEGLEEPKDRAPTLIVREVLEESMQFLSPSAPEAPVAQRSSGCEADHPNIEQLFDQQMLKLVKYLLRREKLNEKAWLPVIWPLVTIIQLFPLRKEEVEARKVAFSVQPDIPFRKDEMDVLKYVHVKTLTSSTKPNGKLIHGVICSKSVANKRMRQSFSKPQILILTESLEYDRKGGRLGSLDPVLAQERITLASAVGKICSFQPDLVLVQKSVAYIAQQLLHETGITLVCGLKEKVIARIARACQGDKIPRIEGQIVTPKLGTCGEFRAETQMLVGGGKKNLLFFTDCAKELGCSVLLTGRNSGELRRAKRALRFAVFAAYSAKLEMALLDSANICLADDNRRLCNADSSCGVCLDNASEEPAAEAVGMGAELGSSVFFGSPFLRVGLPFLETAKGKVSPHAAYFQGLAKDGMYRYKSLHEIDEAPPVPPDPVLDEYVAIKTRIDAAPGHGFLGAALTEPVGGRATATLLASYRASNARLFREKLAAAQEATAAERSAAALGQAEAGGPLDVLSPYHHLKLAVLFSSFSLKSENAPEFCIDPWVALMSYFGRADLPLGDFLTRYCFNKDYMCPKIKQNDTKHCEVGMLEHVRKIAHRHACLEITSQAIMEDERKGVENEAEDGEPGILVWDWCGQCKSTTPASRMSPSLWHLSFAKYLDYLFNGRALPSHIGDSSGGLCGHCAFHQHDHYFAFANYVASFKLARIRLFEVAFSPMTCAIAPTTLTVRSLVDESKAVSEVASSLFTEMLEQTCALKEHEDAGPFRQLLNDLVAVNEQGQAEFRDRLSGVQERLTALRPIDSRELTSDDAAALTLADGLTRSRQILATALLSWNILISDWQNAKKRAQLDTPSAAPKSGEPSSAEAAGSPNASPIKRPSSTDEIKAAATEAPTTHPPAASLAVLEEVKASADMKKVHSSQRLEKLAFPACLRALAQPFPPSEHYTLPPTIFPVVIRDGEVGSVLAFALASCDYESRRKAIRTKFGFGDDLDRPDLVAAPIEMTTDLLTSASPHHIELQFSDAASKYFVRVYYAEHFRVLRRVLMEEQSNSAFIRSLSRSDGWTPKGGKSGAAFFRTRDKRFIIKTMSTFEISSFIKFAPAYFHYVATSRRSKKPSALCKVYGVFKVCWKNETTREQEKKDVLVMEYLFYGAPGISRVYDLKGSLRNRLARGHGASGHKDEGGWVELDENLLQQAWGSAYYLRPHSRSLLSTAIHNDSHFLSTHHVMDYSLLVGVAEGTGELTLGVIDYIRTYTLDKKMEFWVKSLAVPTSTLPTVVSPEMYRSRFTDAIEIYFPVAPDQWAGLSQGLQY